MECDNVAEAWPLPPQEPDALNIGFHHLSSNLEMRKGGSLWHHYPPGIREEALWSFASQLSLTCCDLTESSLVVIHFQSSIGAWWASHTVTVKRVTQGHACH